MDLQIGQKLSLNQNLSPIMIQSLSLLPMNTQELTEYIKKEIEKNPALEIPDYSYSSYNSDYDSPSDSSLYGSNEFNNGEKENSHFEEHDADYNYTKDEYLNSDYAGSDYSNNEYSSSTYINSDDKQNFIENISNSDETLSEHLLSQLGTLSLTTNERKIGEILIGNLDSNGFLTLPIKSIFSNTNFSEDEIEKMIITLQGLDPVGVCTLDYKESLTVQAKYLNLNPEDLFFISSIINNYLLLLKNNNYSDLSKKLGISEEDTASYVSIIKTLNPFPGRNYRTGSNKYGNNAYIIPDVSIIFNGEDIEVNLNKANLPEIRISETFKEMSLINKNNKELQDYIKNSINQAEALILMVNLRYKTLLKACVSLSKFQRDFFISGPSFLKSLSLNDVSKDISIHKSTLSRLSQNKFVETKWGIYPLKYFFSQGIGSISRNAIKDKILKIISEYPTLSDQKISLKLKEEGISCARRTVSKYRQELNLNSSYERSYKNKVSPNRV